MKRIISLLSTVTIIAVLTIVVSLSSCKKESPSLNSDKISDQATLNSSERSAGPLKVDLIPIYMDVEDAAHTTPPTGVNTLLFNCVS